MGPITTRRSNVAVCRGPTGSSALVTRAPPPERPCPGTPARSTSSRHHPKGAPQQGLDLSDGLDTADGDGLRHGAQQSTADTDPVGRQGHGELVLLVEAAPDPLPDTDQVDEQRSRHRRRRRRRDRVEHGEDGHEHQCSQGGRRQEHRTEQPARGDDGHRLLVGLGYRLVEAVVHGEESSPEVSGHRLRQVGEVVRRLGAGHSDAQLGQAQDARREGLDEVHRLDPRHGQLLGVASQQAGLDPQRGAVERPPGDNQCTTPNTTPNTATAIQMTSCVAGL